MKKTLLGFVAVAAIGYFAWHWFAPGPNPPPPATQPQAHSTPVKPGSAQAIPGKRPDVKSATTTPASAVATRQPPLAPEGTYFLVQRVSLQTDSGVVGFAPGTKVTLVEKGDPLSVVSDGKYQFSVALSQLTNDLNIARDVARSDYAAQAQIATAIDQSVRQYEQQQRDALTAAEKEKAQKKPSQKNASRRSPTPAQRR